MFKKLNINLNQKEMSPFFLFEKVTSLKAELMAEPTVESKSM